MMRTVRTTVLLTLLVAACSDSDPGKTGATSSGGAGHGGKTAIASAGSTTAGRPNAGAPVMSGGATSVAGKTHTACTGDLEKVQSSSGLCVAKMATIASPSTAASKGYSIDVTEVTKGQYADWLTTDPALPPSTDIDCGWKTSYAPQGAGYTGADADHHPAVGVDWCDARAYCTGIGKRLCGAIGGGSNDYDHPSNPDLSQWHRACSAAGLHKFPYGDSYQPNTCNGLDREAGTTVAVGSLKGCASGAADGAAVYDLSGNVWEWEDSCFTAGQWGYCHLRGASYASTKYSFGCDFGGYNQRYYAYPYVGFRCCSDTPSVDANVPSGAGGSPNTDAGGASNIGVAGAAGPSVESGGAAGGPNAATAGAAGASSPPVDPRCGGDGPSCDGGLTCGDASCCQSLLVPGGSYNRMVNGSAFPATISDVCLDRYEITVARFRKFAAAYDTWRAAGHPVAGEGAHGAIAGSGWDVAWNSKLPATGAELTDANHVNCSAKQRATWNDTPRSATEENYPLNCLGWFQAFAFCIWDGGYLPTEAEWEYTMVGGPEQRSYTWGNDATEPFPANYCSYMVLENCTPHIAVGSFPGSDARWGHSDVGGGVWEWMLDWYRPNLPATCADCANLTPASNRSLRGGGWVDDPWDLEASFRYYFSMTFPDDRIGARCARAPR